ncbi:WhiB family transcriptional regulator [Streptomyces sp. H62]
MTAYRSPPLWARESGTPARTRARIDHGVWGGTTDPVRRALLRRRPTITSRRRLLEAARAEHEQQLSALSEPSACRAKQVAQAG